MYYVTQGLSCKTTMFLSVALAWFAQADVNRTGVVSSSSGCSLTARLWENDKLLAEKD